MPGEGGCCRTGGRPGPAGSCQHHRHQNRHQNRHELEGAPRYPDEETETWTCSGPGCRRLFSCSPGDLCRPFNNPLSGSFRKVSAAGGGFRKGPGRQTHRTPGPSFLSVPPCASLPVLAQLEVVPVWEEPSFLHVPLQSQALGLPGRTSLVLCLSVTLSPPRQQKQHLPPGTQSGLRDG